AARPRSLRSPSQVGGTMTARETPATFISPSRSCAEKGVSLGGLCSIFGHGRSGVSAAHMWTWESAIIMMLGLADKPRHYSETLMLFSVMILRQLASSPAITFLNSSGVFPMTSLPCSSIALMTSGIFAILASVVPSLLTTAGGVAPG